MFRRRSKHDDDTPQVPKPGGRLRRARIIAIVVGLVGAILIGAPSTAHATPSHAQTSVWCENQTGERLRDMGLTCAFEAGTRLHHVLDSSTGRDGRNQIPSDEILALDSARVAEVNDRLTPADIYAADSLMSHSGHNNESTAIAPAIPEGCSLITWGGFPPTPSVGVGDWIVCELTRAFASIGNFFDAVLNNPLTQISSGEWRIAWGMAAQWAGVFSIIAIALCAVEIMAGLIGRDSGRIVRGVLFTVGAWPLTAFSLLLFGRLVWIGDFLASQILRTAVDSVMLDATPGSAALGAAGLAGAYLTTGAVMATAMTGILATLPVNPAAWFFIAIVILGGILALLLLMAVMLIVTYSQLLLAAFAPIALMLVGFKGTRPMSAKWLQMAVALLLVKPVIAGVIALNLRFIVAGGVDGFVLGTLGMLLAVFSPAAVFALVGFTGAQLGAAAAAAHGGLKAAGLAAAERGQEAVKYKQSDAGQLADADNQSGGADSSEGGDDRSGGGDGAGVAGGTGTTGDPGTAPDCDTATGDSSSIDGEGSSAPDANGTSGLDDAAQAGDRSGRSGDQNDVDGNSDAVALADANDATDDADADRSGEGNPSNEGNPSSDTRNAAGADADAAEPDSATAGTGATSADATSPDAANTAGAGVDKPVSTAEAKTAGSDAEQAQPDTTADSSASGSIDADPRKTGDAGPADGGNPPLSGSGQAPDSSSNPTSPEPGEAPSPSGTSSPAGSQPGSAKLKRSKGQQPDQSSRPKVDWGGTAAAFLSQPRSGSPAARLHQRWQEAADRSQAQQAPNSPWTDRGGK